MEKVRFTVDEMQTRLAEFGFGWNDTTAVQAYTVHDFHPVAPMKWSAAARRVPA